MMEDKCCYVQGEIFDGGNINLSIMLQQQKMVIIKNINCTYFILINFIDELRIKIEENK